MSTITDSSESCETLQQVFEVALNQAAQETANKEHTSETNSQTKNNNSKNLLQPRTFDAEWSHFRAWMDRPADWNRANQNNCDHGLNSVQVVALSEHILKRTSIVLDCEKLSSFLRCMRLLMRDPDTTSLLRCPDCVKLFLEMWSTLQENSERGKDVWSQQAQVEAAACVVNAGFDNPLAIEAILSNGGVRVAAKALRQGGKHMLMLCACRLVSTVLSIEGPSTALALNECTSEQIISSICSLICFVSDFSFSTKQNWQSKIMLCIEGVKAIFALGCVLPNGLVDVNTLNDPGSIDKLARQIPKILGLPDSLTHVADVKSATISLLLYMPDQYAQVIHDSNTVVPTVLAHLESTLRQVHSSSKHRINSAATVAPAMVVVAQLVQFDDRILNLCEDFVFPQQLAQACLPHSCTKQSGLSLGPFKLGDTPVPVDNMKPQDAPRGSLRFLLIKLLTHPNEIMQSCASELLFQLCHQNADLMVNRTGLGNCMGFLHSRNLLPAHFPIPSPTKSSAYVA